MKSDEQLLFEDACAIYAEHGVDVKKALHTLKQIKIGLHAWQGDDVAGFENTWTKSLSGGCQVTGNYPGRAETAEELMRDLDMARKFLPDLGKIVLQGHEVDRAIPGRDRDEFSMENFQTWLAWAKERKIGVEVAPAFYSHPKLDHGLSLSHPDRGIREFWINHAKACRRITETFARETGVAGVCNVWVPDGFKDTPANRMEPRRRLKESLDEIFSDKLDESLITDAVESKLFGIGVESCTVGSHDFYLTYAARNGKAICLDSGHFHPTESIADKLSAILIQQGKILLHVSRGVRWDSDHVLTLNDELLDLGREIAHCGTDNIVIGLDYFDATINRIAAWIIGYRNIQKALLIGLLTPFSEIEKAENNWDFTARLAIQEESKLLPWQSVWNACCLRNGAPPMTQVLSELRGYEKNVLFKRGR